MSDSLSYRTLGQDNPKGLPRIFFSSHPDDFEKYFEMVWKWINEFQKAALFYESPDKEMPPDQLYADLETMQLIIVPITTKLLQDPNRTMEIILPFANQEKIPVLPLMMEQGLDDLFNRKIGNIQYLAPFNSDPTAIPFKTKFSRYLENSFLSNEMIRKVRDAFDAYIFLSYRKKDRTSAQELMKLIHKDRSCRDFAIWYDEFLVPGEDFNDAIQKALAESKMFALVVTPNLLERPAGHPNYIMQYEYPQALESGKPILPVEMVETDRAGLAETFEAMPECINKTRAEAIAGWITDHAYDIALHEDSPQHNYFIGLAYLDGIDVEVDRERAVRLITESAQSGLEEAIRKLVFMYHDGNGVTRDYQISIKWRLKLLEVIRQQYQKGQRDQGGTVLIRETGELGDAYMEAGQLEEARTTYQEMKELASEASLRYPSDETKQLLADSLYKLGEVYHSMGIPDRAVQWYQDALQVHDGEAGNHKTRWILYNKIGDALLSQFDRMREGPAMHEKALEEITALAQTESSLDIRRSLAISYRKTFELEKALEITEAIAEETGTVEDRRELSVLYNTMGSQLRTEERRSRQQCFEKAYEIRKAIADETGTFGAYRDLARVFENLGEAARKKANDEETGYDQAIGYYTRAVEIRRRLNDEIHSDKTRYELAWSLVCLGIPGDKKALREAAEICDSLVKEYPKDRRYRMILGRIMEFLNDPAAREKYCRHSYRYGLDY